MEGLAAELVTHANDVTFICCDPTKPDRQDARLGVKFLLGSSTRLGYAWVLVPIRAICYARAPTSAPIGRSMQIHTPTRGFILQLAVHHKLGRVVQQNQG